MLANCTNRPDLLNKRPTLSSPLRTQFAMTQDFTDQEWKVAQSWCLGKTIRSIVERTVSSWKHNEAFFSKLLKEIGVRYCTLVSLGFWHWCAGCAMLESASRTGMNRLWLRARRTARQSFPLSRRSPISFAGATRKANFQLVNAALRRDSEIGAAFHAISLQWLEERSIFNWRAYQF